jgi:hypothetical protein
LLPRWGWSRGDLIARGGATTTWASPLQTLTLKTEKGTHKTRGGALPPTRVAIHRTPMALRPHRRGRLTAAPVGGEEDLDLLFRRASRCGFLIWIRTWLHPVTKWRQSGN